MVALSAKDFRVTFDLIIREISSIFLADVEQTREKLDEAIGRID
jgi:hypothetical protein